jgi:probable phosphoglycerate mutase
MPRFEDRAWAALGRIAATSRPGQRVLVVTHGGVIRAIVRRVLGVRARRALVGCGNTALTVLRWERDGAIRLVAYNCAAHLQGGASGADEVVEGSRDEIVRRTLAHLALSADTADRLAPAEATRAVLVPHPREPSLRRFGIPAPLS